VKNKIKTFLFAMSGVILFNVNNADAKEIKIEPLTAGVQKTFSEYFKNEKQELKEDDKRKDKKVKKYYDVDLSEKLQQYIIDESKKYEIEPTIVFAIIEHESNCVENAIGDEGRSKGLMQIQERYWKNLMDELNVSDLMNPYDNVKVGIAILNVFKNKNKNIYWILAAYNGGESYANKIDCSKNKYANKITRRSEYLKEMYGGK
jgi:soluble lytic murein transglycosylase-like protein